MHNRRQSPLLHMQTLDWMDAVLLLPPRNDSKSLGNSLVHWLAVLTELVQARATACCTDNQKATMHPREACVRIGVYVVNSS